jgi:hypothetical protein
MAVVLLEVSCFEQDFDTCGGLSILSIHKEIKMFCKYNIEYLIGVIVITVILIYIHT